MKFVNNKLYKAGYTIEKIGDNILVLNFDGTRQIGVKDVEEIKKSALELVSHKPFKNIVNFGSKSGLVSNDAKKFISQDSDFLRLKICDALITTSFMSSLLIGSYIKLFNPKTPTKSFSNFEEALAWVKSFS